MLQWNDLHAYNAVHVVRVPEPLHIGRLSSVIRGTFERKGLTGLVLNRREGTFEYHGGPAELEIKVLGPVGGPVSPQPEPDAAKGGGSAQRHLLDPGAPVAPGAGSARELAEDGPGWTASLPQELERQLNTPFTYQDAFTPFRCVVFSEPQAFSLAVAYFHPVADAESVVFLLKAIIEAYRGTGVTEGEYERYPAPRDKLLRSHPGVLARKLASLPAAIRKMRFTCRPNYRDAGNCHNQVTMFSLSSATLGGLVQSAKASGVTLNDLFLGILMKAASELAPNRSPSDRRKNLAIGCIVNTRRDLGLDGRRDFGLFLGSFVVHHAAPVGIRLADLARDLGRQTRDIKQKRLYLGAALELRFGRLMSSLFSESRRRKLYQKHYPMWGGLTNMNLNALWPQLAEDRPVDYVRAVCTGPVTPLVASITTMGQAAQVSLTYRSTVFGAADIERVKATFLGAARLTDRS
jgi:hypothetical protein